MTHVARYILELRKAQKISRAELVDELALANIDTTENTIYRVEKRNQKPGGDLLLGLVIGVRGSLADMRRLLWDAGASMDLAETLARERFQRLRSAEGRMLAEMEEGTETMSATLRELRSHPDNGNAQPGLLRPANGDA